MSVLPDTSIWVDFLRNLEPAASQLERLVRRGEVVVCGPVLAELHAGARTDRAADELDGLAALRFVEATRSTWSRAGELSRALRARGDSVPLLDAVIALCCVQADVHLWTRDAAFQRIHRALPQLGFYTPT